MLSEVCDPFGLQTDSSREWGNGEFLSEAGDSFLSIAGEEFTAMRHSQ